MFIQTDLWIEEVINVEYAQMLPMLAREDQ